MTTSSEQQQGEWSSSLFSCLREPSICALSFFCPCVQYGRNMEKLDGSSRLGHCCFYAFCLCICRPCIAHREHRSELRKAYGLKGSWQHDCLATWLCPWCAIAQEARELQTRGPPPAQSMAMMEMEERPAAATSAPQVVASELHRVIIGRPTAAVNYIMGHKQQDQTGLAAQEE
jgi:Cys-rich protein (TIGR01571 family)